MKKILDEKVMPKPPELRGEAAYWHKAYKDVRRKLQIAMMELAKIEAGSPLGDPIKQETCADVLREMVEMMDCGDEHGEGSPWHKRAKAALERESAEGGPSVVGERSENNTRGE